MATSDVFSLHTKGGFDAQDFLGAPAFGLAAVVLTGIGTFSLYGISLSQSLVSSTSLHLSVAVLVAAGLLGLSWATNRTGDSWDDLDEIESAAVGGGAVLLVGMAAIPAIRSFVLGSQAVGTAAFVVLSAAYTVTSWY